MKHRRLQKSKEAVSPVIATLLLILIAVAAAAALYLWISGWQAGASGKITSPSAEYSITIGGSTTLYPVTQMAIPWFEQNNSGVTVSDSQGGSGAGLLALCANQIDIAAMSRPVSSSDPAQCAANVVQTVVGYDAAVVDVPSANVNGLVSMSSQEALIVFWQNGGQPVLSVGSSSNPTLGVGSQTAVAGSVISGTNASEYVPANWGITTPTGAGSVFEWSNVPTKACFDGAAATNGASVTNGYITSLTGYHGPCSSVWAYPTSTSGIDLYARYDNSGTEEAFDNNMLGIKCGTDNQLDTCNFAVLNTPSTPSDSAVNEYVGNPALLAAIAKDPNALGINSWGLSEAPTSQGGGAASTSGTTGTCATSGATVCIVSFVGAAQVSDGAYLKGIVPTLSNIITGVQAGYGNEVSGGYVGWRPLQYVTYGTPTGEDERFIQFMTAPGNNVELMDANFFISYTVVPVNTPAPA